MAVRRSAAALAVAALALTAGAGGAADAAPLASHEPAFFEKLLAGRAYVYTLPWRPLKSVAGFVLRPGGRTLICTYRGGGGRVTNRTHWRVLPTARYRALFSLYKDGDDPRDRRFRAVPIYAGESGRLHLEAWHRRDFRYATRYDGWVQESWPRFLADACPDLVEDLPEGMAINEKQTAETLEAMRGQDPEAPIRRFPGWQNAGLGSTVLREELAAFLTRRDGEILVGLDGARYALALGAQSGDELWRLDDAGGIDETFHLRVRADGIAFRPEGGGEAWTYRIGEPFPLLPTGRRYAAAAMMDWLIASREIVVLPFQEVEAGFRFGPDGALRALKAGGGELPGTWRWSRGDLVLRLDGIAEGARYRWRELASHVGWRKAG